MICRICKFNNNEEYLLVKEKQFGFLDEFNYLKCKNCGCLQITEYPKNLSKYYPKNYYSFSRKVVIEKSKFKRFIKLKITHYITQYKFSFIGFFFYKIFGAGFAGKLKATKVNCNSSILDIGTGSGFNLIRLYNYGFEQLHGIDPYIETEWKYKENIRVEKKDIFDLQGSYDLIMMNHALEHMPHQDKIFAKLYQLLNTEGVLLIRIPLADGYAMRKFGANCVSIDAPRHLYLHSIESLILLADKHNLKLDRYFYDSTDAQFWGSIQFEQNIPKMAKESHYVDPKNSMFSKKEIDRFKREAKRLNNLNDGNIASFYFKKIR